jgi:hypothetical protein
MIIGYRPLSPGLNGAGDDVARFVVGRRYRAVRFVPPEMR